MPPKGSSACPFSDQDIKLLARFTARRLREHGINVRQFRARFSGATCYVTVESQTTVVELTFKVSQLVTIVAFLRRVAVAEWN